tara:strand:- start:1662 stop:1925 length:264 start_codon:yes stop_codon:yes gene_type:complete
MQRKNKEAQKISPEKNADFKVGDLVKIKENAHFVEEGFIGAAGLIVAFNETGYPKGFSGRAKDGIMYVVAAQGRNIKLFEDEMEKVQ